MAGGASFRRPPGRCASRVAELGVAANPRLHWERRANGARRSSRCRSPRPQLRDFTKAIPATNARPAEAEAGPRPPARQGGAAESTNTKPSDGNARGSCRSAACLGASPVASASGSQDRRDPAPDSHHSTTAPPAGRPQPDISAWQRIGHFYLALTAEQRRLLKTREKASPKGCSGDQVAALDKIEIMLLSQLGLHSRQ